ncbi:hypothetical protein AB205_0048310 [Aquarana catesbeiana]|uniref:Myb/SANT-like DNA-binding domain-containing protein n=1 Tax=Aquarana catesbeiana TaxID=8400 RepID=A0A2G9R6U3_AQUCT|nr:hypothetical protein AB205_0048310 [Aquarana catesbeiana]
MAETQQVLNSSNEEESPEQETSRSRRRRFRASNMSFEEMVEMVDILKRADYDGKYGPYLNPNVRKAEIMTKVVKSLRRNFGVRRSKEQLRKRWSDLKLREQDQYRRIKKVLLKSDVQVVVPKSNNFTSDSARRMIQEIMFCSRDLDIIKEKTKEIEQGLKNMIAVLGRI